MSKLFSFVFSFGLLLSVDAANADRLHLVPNVSISLNTESKSAEIEIVVHNHGNVDAKNVSISIPTLNERFQLATSLAPKNEEALKVTTTFEALGLSELGRYSIPYSIRYHDPNFFPANVTYVADLHYSKWPSEFLTYGFEKHAPDNRYQLAGSFGETFWVRNISEKPVTISKIRLVTSSDLEAGAPSITTPLTIAPNSKKSFQIELNSTSNSLLGSIYGSFLILEGVHESLHFSEPFMFQVEVAESKANTQSMFIAAIVGIALVFLIARLRRKTS